MFIPLDVGPDQASEKPLIIVFFIDFYLQSVLDLLKNVEIILQSE